MADWFERAKQAVAIPAVKTTQTAEMDTALPQKEKGFGEQAGEVLGGIAGTAIGGLGEIGRFVEETPSSLYQLATSPAQTFKDFAREVDLIRRGQTLPEGAPTTGMQRVLTGALGQTGKQVETKKTGEKVYQDTPLYEAAKRDALGLGEGLLGLASAAIGFNEDELEKAQAQMKKEGRPTEGFLAGVERGGRAGFKKGEELVGGFPVGGVFLGQAGRDLFFGEEGKKFYREAPITTLVSALPILKGLGRGIAAGTLSAAQKAKVATLLSKTTNPATGKPFVSVDELTQAIEAIEQKAKGLPEGETLSPAEAGVQAYKGIPAEALTQAVKEQAGKVLPRVGKAATKLVERAPYVAAAYSLGGIPAAAIAGTLAYGGPLLDAFKGTKTPVLGKVAAASVKPRAKATRVAVERRTYEEPMAEQVGEETLTAAGEARAIEAKLGDLPERFGKSQRTFFDVPPEPTLEGVRQPTTFEKLNQERNALADKLTQARQLLETPNLPEEAKPLVNDAITQLQDEISNNERQANIAAGTTDITDFRLPSKQNYLQQQETLLSRTNKQLRADPTNTTLKGLQEQLTKRIEETRDEIESLKLTRKETFKTATETQTAEAEAKAQADLKIAETEFRRANPIERQIGTQEGGVLNVAAEGGTKFSYEGEGPRVVQINPNATENATLYEQLKRALSGTTLSPYDEITGREVKEKLPNVERLFTQIAASRQMPTLMLLDPEVRAKTIELIEKQTGNLTKEGRVVLDQTLQDIGNEGFGEVGPKGVIPRLTIKNYTITSPFGNQQPVVNNLGALVGEAANQLGKAPERVVFNNFLKRVVEIEKVKPLVGKANEFTAAFDDVVSGRKGDFKEALSNLYQESKTNPNFVVENLVSVVDKERALKAIEAALIDPFYPDEIITGSKDPAYPQFLKDLRDKIKGFERTAEGLYTYESVAKLPLDRQFDLAAADPAISTKLGGLIKRLATTYNPVVIFGNYVGNAFVESQATGKTPQRVLVEQANRAYKFAERIKRGKETQQLSITDEIALRAIPNDSLNVIETASNFAVEEAGKYNPLRLARILYDWGDRLPKTAEAVKQSEKLVSTLEKSPANKTFLLQTGPNLDVYLVKNGPNSYSVINPRTGNIVGSGTLDSPTIKRVLGASVRSALETKFPDVKSLPEWYEKIARQKGLAGLASSLVVFQPFLSYTIKAADTPFRRGVMGNLLLMNDNPILAEFGGTGGKQSVGSIFSKIYETATAAETKQLLASRGIMNAAMANLNSLTNEERQQLREYFAFIPAESRSLVIGKLMTMVKGDQVRKIGQPSYATTWAMTDNYIRTIPAIVNTITTLTGYDAKKVAEMLGSENPEADLVIDRYSSGTAPEMRDLFKAIGAVGGQATKVFQKITDPRLGAAQATEKDYLAIFGVAGKVIAPLLGTGEAGVSKQELDVKGERNKFKDAVSWFLIDNLVSGAILDPKTNDLKVQKLIKGSYDECWNSLIQPLMNDAEQARKKGDEERAEALEQMASDINDKIQERITANVEARVETLSKIGLDTNLKSGDYKKVFRDIEGKEIMVRPEETPEEPTEPAVFERTKPYNYPETPAGKYKMEE